jgi:hypothetical protein
MLKWQNDKHSKFTPTPSPNLVVQTLTPEEKWAARFVQKILKKKQCIKAKCAQAGLPTLFRRDIRFGFDMKIGATRRFSNFLKIHTVHDFQSIKVR